MYVDHRRKLIFLAAPRTASRAVHAVFRGIRWGASHHAVDPQSIATFQKRGYRSFCVVRDHASWCRSFWTHRLETQAALPPLYEWLVEFLEQSAYLDRDGNEAWAFKRFTDHADHILRYERLATDLEAVLGPVALPSIGVSPTISPPNDPRVRDLIASTFRTESISLGYPTPIP